MDNTADLVRKLNQAEQALKLAYRSHHLGDDRVGSIELSDVLLDALCEIIGDAGYQNWLKGVKLELESPHVR